mgnify:CR=1 FL=1
MKRIWCAQAWLGGDSLTPGVLVSVDDDGKISALTHQGQPPADVEALHGWIFPGFVNDHSHVFHRVLRGRTHAGRGSFWNWRDQMYAVAAVTIVSGAVAERIQLPSYAACCFVTCARSLA